MSTDAQLRDQALAELAKTTVGRINSKWKTPPAGTHWANAEALLAQIGVTPAPPAAWTVAAPGSTGQPVRTANHPAGVGVNPRPGFTGVAYTEDQVVNGGGDSAFLVEPDVPGLTFRRIRGNNVVGDQVGPTDEHNQHHFFYVDAANTTIFDSGATASEHGDGYFSVRRGGFLGDRFTADGFQLPLTILANDEIAAPVVWRHGRITNPRSTPVYLDVNEAAKMVYPVTIEDVVAPLVGGLFLNANAAVLAASVTLIGCRLPDGSPITPPMVRGVPASALHIS